MFGRQWPLVVGRLLGGRWIAWQASSPSTPVVLKHETLALVVVHLVVRQRVQARVPYFPFSRRLEHFGTFRSLSPAEGALRALNHTAALHASAFITSSGSLDFRGFTTFTVEDKYQTF